MANFPKTSQSLRPRCRKTVRVFPKIWISFHRPLVYIIYGNFELIRSNGQGGDSSNMMTATTPTLHFGNFNPKWLTSGWFRGVATIIFFARLLTMNIYTKFRSSTTNFVGGRPIGFWISTFQGGAVATFLYRHLRNLYVHTIFHTSELCAKFGEFSCMFRGWN